MIVPSFTALLGRAATDLLRRLRPVQALRIALAHALLQLGILLLQPRAFSDTWPQNLIPALQTLDMIPPRHELCNIFPTFVTATNF